MAWTAPATFTVGQVVTAANLNTHLRDNLLAIDALLDVATGTFTDGGLLLGSGTGTITAMARMTAGQVAVGQSAGDPVARQILVDGGTSPLLRHEVGGVEADISGIAAGGILRGAAAGSMSILPVGSATYVLAVDAGGTNLAYKAGGAAVVTGTYTGDGATSKAVTGLGFAPKLLTIVQRVTAGGRTAMADDGYLVTTDKMVDDHASGMAFTPGDSGTGAPSYITDRIKSLDADGFTVTDGGFDDHPNKNTVVYNYVAVG